MDLALTLRESQNKCDRIFDAIESYCAYVDLIDTSDEDIVDLYGAFEAKGNKKSAEEQEKEQTAAKEEKKQIGIAAGLKAIAETIMQFFRNLFGIGKTKTLPNDIPFAWPKGYDKPDTMYNKMNQELDKIMKSIKSGSDTATINKMISDFNQNSNKLIDEIKEEQAKMRARKNFGSGGKHNAGTWIMAHLSPNTLGYKINKMILKYKDATDQEIKMIKAYQRQVFNLAILVKGCEIAQTDTSTVASQAEKVVRKSVGENNGNQKKADKAYARYDKTRQQVAKKEQKAAEKKGG